MTLRQSFAGGYIAIIVGLVLMGWIFVGAGPQSLLLFGLGFALAVGGVKVAAAAMRQRNAALAGGAGPHEMKLGPGGWVFAIIGGLIAVFAGGCILLWVMSPSGGSDFKTSIASTLVFSGFPFAIGMVIWVLAMATKKPVSTRSSGTGD